MAARLWRSVLGTELALAIVIAWLIARRNPSAAHLWLGVDIVVLVFLALQYLAGFGVLIASRALAPATTRRPRRTNALRAALSEPVHFLLAQLAMARGAGASSAAPGARGPLLLVHGLACNAAVWHWLVPRLRTAGFGPIRAVGFVPFGVDIDTLARGVVQELNELQAQSGAPATLLAHSLGGLVCRAALRELDPRVVRRLVTVGTPHHGAALARLGRMAPVMQMRPGSSWLAGLNACPPPSPVPITSLYSADDNLVTPAASAELAGARQQELHGLGHFGLVVSRRGAEQVLHALQEAT